MNDLLGLSFANALICNSFQHTFSWLLGFSLIYRQGYSCTTTLHFTTNASTFHSHGGDSEPRHLNRIGLMPEWSAICGVRDALLPCSRSQSPRKPWVRFCPNYLTRTRFAKDSRSWLSVDERETLRPLTDLVSGTHEAFGSAQRRGMYRSRRAMYLGSHMINWPRKEAEGTDGHRGVS